MSVTIGSRFCTAGGLDAQDRAQLVAQQVRPPEARAHTAQAEGRIVFVRQWKILDRLVAADVHGAYRQRPAVEQVRDRLINVELLLLGGRQAPIAEKELGAQQSTPLGAQTHCGGRIARRPEVRVHMDSAAVRGARLALGHTALGITGRAAELRPTPASAT
jgi:hypothetical protein